MGQTSQISKRLLTYGFLASLTCGIVSIQGLSLAFIGELFIIDITGGLSVNLSRDSFWRLVVGGLILDSDSRLFEGTIVKGQQKLASVILGDFIISSILDPFGNIILNQRPIQASYRWIIECPAPGIIDRQSVSEPLQTGIITIDSMIPVGRGQRELIIGDRQTGKTSLGLDTIVNQKLEAVSCVYLTIGQQASSVVEAYISLLNTDSSFHVSLVASTAASSALYQYLSPYSASALGEYLMVVNELPVFMLLDDLSKHAVSFREISLLLRRPPGREAYPGEIFFVHSRLLERSAKLSSARGGGSLTCFPVIQTLAGDVSAYIATNVISITDGQILVSQDLFNSGILPPIDVGLSVTRVGSSAQWNGIKPVGGSYKLELAQFVELQSFSQFSSDLSSETKSILDRGSRLLNVISQSNGNPISLRHQVIFLSIVGQGFIDLVEIQQVQKFISFIRSLPNWLFIWVPISLISPASLVVN